MTDRKKELLAQLEWQRDMGVDEAVSPECLKLGEIPESAWDTPSSSPSLSKVKAESEHRKVLKKNPSSLTDSISLSKKDDDPGSVPVPRRGISSKPMSSRDVAAHAGNLAQLRHAVETFEGCALRLTALNTVFSDGNPVSGIMVVGEAPGADEDRQGKPFVGLSGQLLDKMFAAIGLGRENFYITNIIPWRPPGNRQPTTEEIAMCLPFVHRHIELVKPEVLIFAGGVAAKALMDSRDGIMKLRGRWLEYSNPDSDTGTQIPARAIYHPAFLLRSPGQKRVAWEDMLQIMVRLEQSGLPREKNY